MQKTTRRDLRGRTLTQAQKQTLRGAFRKAISLVRDGKWCRNEIRNLNGQYCALGLVGMGTEGSAGGFYNTNAREMLVLLDAAIPDRWFEELSVRANGNRGRDRYRENNGIWRGQMRIESRVASWNNTRPSERDIIGWFQEADQLLDEVPTA